MNPPGLAPPSLLPDPDGITGPEYILLCGIDIDSLLQYPPPPIPLSRYSSDRLKFDWSDEFPYSSCLGRGSAKPRPLSSKWPPLPTSCLGVPYQLGSVDGA